MQTATTSLIKKWKLKFILPNGVWIPQFGKPDFILFGKNSSQRLQSGKKMVMGFKADFDNAYIFEEDFHGKTIATYDKSLKKFILDS